MKTLLILLLIMTSFTDPPRKVLLFYKVDGEQRFKSQVQILNKARKGILERDIEIEPVPYSAKNEEIWKKWDIKQQQAFTFVLVGRDGGEKLRSAEVVTIDKLFGLIDAMPMRKTEMKIQR